MEKVGGDDCVSTRLSEGSVYDQCTSFIVKTCIRRDEKSV